jgi:hypothetical protein
MLKNKIIKIIIFYIIKSFFLFKDNLKAEIIWKIIFEALIKIEIKNFNFLLQLFNNVLPFNYII